jgi:hypothetical protein
MSEELFHAYQCCGILTRQLKEHITAKKCGQCKLAALFFALSETYSGKTVNEIKEALLCRICTAAHLIV